MPSAGGRLRQLLSEDGLLVVPGVTDAFVARLAEQAGFPAIFTTGAGIANTKLGLPDLGLATMTESLLITSRIADAVDIPVIADADTGYGNHLNVTRTVREFERAGLAGIFLEDQTSPKRCGHFAGKTVIDVAEMVEKLVAARMARKDPDFVLVARTDAIAVEGIEGALSRAKAYVAAGADVIFVEAPESVEQMAAIPKRVRVPCVINLVEGGVTPMLPANELEAMGFKLAVYANVALRMAAQAVRRGFETLRREGTTLSLVDDMMSWADRQRTAGLERWQALDDGVGAEAAVVLEALRTSEAGPTDA